MSRYILLSEFFPPAHGGIEDSLRHLLPVLGSDLTVVAPGQSEGEHPAYQRLYRSLFSGRMKPSWLWLVPWLWSQRRATELIICGHMSAAATAGWLLRRWGMKYVVFVHGNDLLTEVQRGRGWVVKRILQSAEWVGTNSDFTAAEIHQRGVPWSKIIKLFPMVEDTTLKIQAVASAPPALVTVCRLVERKNVAAVISAVSQLRQEFPNLIYHVIGDGPERSKLEALAIQLGVQAMVQFHGSLDDQAKWEVMQHATVAVMTPLASGAQVEGLGLFYLEASAIGLPVVATRGGGVVEAVSDGQTGILVEPGNDQALVQALRQLLNDPTLAQRFGQAGRAYVVPEFTVSTRTKRFEQLLHRHRQSDPPLVSIIMPAYQSATTIGTTLTGVLAQTWPRCEIIVIDDGSTDQLDQALQPFHRQITIQRQSNAGAAAARNTGAGLATGSFLLFLDADTRLDPDMVTTMMVTLQTHPAADYAYSNFHFGPKGFRLREFDGTALQHRNFIHTSSLMRRSAFPGFDPTLKKFQDWDLWLTMLERRSIGLWIPRQLFRVEQRSDGISTWLPRFMYQLPVIGQGRGNATIAKYRAAEAIIRHKHKLV